MRRVASGLYGETAERPIERDERSRALREAALSRGMTTLLQDGIWKVLEGHTDYKQVRSVRIR